MHFPFTPPAENGGRDAVRRATFETEDGAKIIMRAQTPFHFDARHYTITDLRDAMHDHDLYMRPETIIHTDAAHAGIGGDMAWSTVIDPEYAVSSGEYTLALDIQVI